MDLPMTCEKKVICHQEYYYYSHYYHFLYNHLMTKWNDAGRDYIWQYRGHEPARMTKSHTSSYLTR